MIFAGPSYTPRAPDGRRRPRRRLTTNRRTRRLITAGSVLALAVTTGLAAVVVAQRPPAPSPRPSVEATARPTPVAHLPPPPAGTTYRNFVFETAVVEGPTATKAQSKLWFAGGTWWAGLVQPATNRQTIFRLDRDSQIWQDTGTLVDERPFADPDFLWTGEHLYIVTTGPRNSPDHHGRVLRYTLDPELDRFVLDPNFPVTISPTGTTAAVIAQDSTGVVWVAYAAQERIWVVHSLSNDAHWSEPLPLPAATGAVAPEDIASVVAFGPGSIGVMWSNQLEERVYFSVHRDGEAAEDWSAAEVVLDGEGSSDDHINLKAFPDGDGIGVVAALKTSNDEAEPVNGLAPLILLAVRREEGWERHLVGRVQDRHTRPIVVVDPEARLFYVAATSPANGGEILYKRTAIDDIAFDTGRGEPLISSASDPRINNATSAKHGVSAETGLLVMASDNESGRYLHGLVDLGGGLPPADPADPARLEPPPPPSEVQPITLAYNDFQAWPVGPATGTGWVMREGDPPEALTIADDGGQHGLELAAPPGGPSVRACRDHPVPAEGDRLQVRLRAGVEGLGSSDVTIASLRGSGGEAVSVRVTSRGTFAWFDGETKVETDVVAGAGADYGVAIDVDQESRTFDLRIGTPDGDILIERSDVAWRSPDVTRLRSVCLDTAADSAAHLVRLERVIVQEIQVP